MNEKVNNLLFAETKPKFFFLSTVFKAKKNILQKKNFFKERWVGEWRIE